jgi:hypothetical protein
MASPGLNTATFKTNTTGLQKGQVKGCKKKNTSNKFIMKLSQTGTDKNPLQNRIPGITHILQLVMTIPSSISYYAVKVRRRELRAGGNKLSAARGLRRII